MHKSLSFYQQRGCVGGFLRDVSRLRFVILGILVAVCSATGGSNSGTMPALLVLRPVMVLGIGAMIVLPGEWDWRGLRAPAILLAIFAATMAIQLVPLPPAWWAAMPGHDRYAGIVALSPGAWRPISLVPDLTINSLLALLPTLAVIVAFAGMRERDRWNTAWILFCLCTANVLVGLLQVAGGNVLNANNIGDDQSVVTGLLANRNHGAVLLGVMLPLSASLTRILIKKPLVCWLWFGAVACVILPLILLSGSRQGLTLAGLALAAAAAMLVERSESRRAYVLAIVGVVFAIGLIVIVTVVNGRALSIMRLEQFDAANELRIQSFPILLRITRDFLPFGIGYGAFDPVYRGYEPNALLVSTYLNHAHNDLLETLMSGGVLGLAPLFGLLLWLGVRAWTVVRAGAQAAQTAGLAKVAVVIIAMLLSASLGDYPLRTGIMSSVFAIACCWLAIVPRRDTAQRRRGSREVVA